MKRLLAILATVLAVTSCESTEQLGPQFNRERAGSPALNVVSYNVYWGAYVEELMLAEPSEVPIVAAGIWGKVQQTNFNERAVAIVEQVAYADAHVVGLQEVALYRFEQVSDYQGGPLPAPDAEDVLLDFLDILVAALEARGLHYTPAAMSENMDIELPMCTDPDPEVCFPLADIRLTDYDVILVRDDVEWDSESAANGNFLAEMEIDLGGQTIYKPSGWASVDISFKGNQYRIMNTHLEPADVLPGGGVHPELSFLQAMQLEELLGVADASPIPVIMVGDFNSDDDGSTTATYQSVLDAGFVDTWLIGRPRGTGYTSNQAPDLMSATSELFHRIDFIFYRDEVTAGKGKFRGSVAAEVIGEEQGDRTASGLWPSDHAGVAAILRIAPGAP